jgi:hypothetical protein
LRDLYGKISQLNTLPSKTLGLATPEMVLRKGMAAKAAYAL